MTEPVLLLSGSGLPSWIWDEVRAGLGETAVGPRPDSPDAGPAEYAEAALAAVDWPRFTVVAHSVGGVVAQALLAAAPQRVAGVLGVAAVWPAPGRSFAGALPVPQRWLLPVILRLAGTRPPEKQLRAGIGAGLPAATVDRLVAEFTPESRRLFVTAGAQGGRPQRAGYVHTTEDRDVPPALQSTSAAALGGDFRRELATGHLPMLADPAGLREAIADFTRAA
ncbi:alpha/beta fold hydrolase [Pimelobacter simplex]|uniref:alpha/beta fold hydrolase n=1 Tax=Nocardioides simplex TaxID=2045 RepID=UPI0019323B6E|nr:alpha/beta hydrolase [Pimelobacter simplex]